MATSPTVPTPRAHRAPASDPFLRALLETVADLVSIHELDGTFIAASRSVRGLLGWDPDLIEGRHPAGFVHPDDQPILPALFARLQTAGHAEAHMRARHADGTWLPMVLRIRVIEDDADSPQYLLATGEPAAAPRTEEAATISDDRLLRVYEQMSEPFFILDRAFRFTYANPLVVAMRDGDISGLLGRSIYEIFPDLEGTQFETEYKRALHQDVPVHFEEFYAATGCWYEVHAYPSEEGLSVHFRDITERKMVVEKLRLSEHRYAEAYEIERAAAEHLRALDDMKQAFLTSVSHDLRTPLTAIIGYAETLSTYDERLSASTRKQLLGRLAVNARRLHTQVGDLLDLDRLVASSFRPSRTSTDVGALIRDVVSASELGDSHPVEVSCDEVTVPADRGLVERILRNLLSNAVLHTASGTPVWVSVRQADGGALISVEDAGPGIDRALAREIFEPFRQGPTMKPASPRVGIGLSLVARFAGLHGGNAWVEEREGGGSAFRVYLPGNEVTPLSSRTTVGGHASLKARARRARPTPDRTATPASSTSAT